MPFRVQSHPLKRNPVLLSIPAPATELEFQILEHLILRAAKGAFFDKGLVLVGTYFPGPVDGLGRRWTSIVLICL